MLHIHRFTSDVISADLLVVSMAAMIFFSTYLRAAIDGARNWAIIPPLRQTLYRTNSQAHPYNYLSLFTRRNDSLLK